MRFTRSTNSSYFEPSRKFSTETWVASGNLAFDLTIADLNEKQTIKAPQNAKPFDDLVAQLQGVTGGASGSGGGGSTGGGSKYDQCVAGAGTDVAKLQQCADLIGQ